MEVVRTEKADQTSYNENQSGHLNSFQTKNAKL